MTERAKADKAAAGGYGDADGFDALEANLGYRFRDRRLLERALTHRSWANEADDDVQDNQRLEFLGDAVLGVVVATELFHRDRDVDEGALSTRQSRLVCEPALAEVAAEVLDLGRFLRLGRGEEMSGGRQKASLLADAYEALLAAVYLDGGLEAVRQVILTLHRAGLTEVHEQKGAPQDYKSRLQTVVQGEHGTQPVYHIVDEQGPPHDMTFVAEVHVGDHVLGRGEGRSKKDAQQQAAAQALVALAVDETQADEHQADEHQA